MIDIDVTIEEGIRLASHQKLGRNSSLRLRFDEATWALLRVLTRYEDGVTHTSLEAEAIASGDSTDLSLRRMAVSSPYGKRFSERILLPDPQQPIALKLAESKEPGNLLLALVLQLSDDGCELSGSEYAKFVRSIDSPFECGVTVAQTSLVLPIQFLSWSGLAFPREETEPLLFIAESGISFAYWDQTISGIGLWQRGYDDLVAIETSGAGRHREGGAWRGFGFGLQGAAIATMEAALLTRLS